MIKKGLKVRPGDEGMYRSFSRRYLKQKYLRPRPSFKEAEDRSKFSDSTSSSSKVQLSDSQGRQFKYANRKRHDTVKKEANFQPCTLISQEIKPSISTSNLVSSALKGILKDPSISKFTNIGPKERSKRISFVGIDDLPKTMQVKHHLYIKLA